MIRKLINSFRSLMHQKDGFTMTELIVAMALFIVVISVSSGTFIQGIRSERSIVTSTSVNSNVTEAMERMAREIRTGYNFNGTTAARLDFINSNNQEVNYKLSGSSIVRCVGADSTCAYLPITANKIVINSLKFASSGTGEPDSLPPRITILIQVTSTNDTVINFQTTVASRILGT